MALGATPGSILRLVLRQSLPMIAAGAIAGVGIALAATTRVQPLLFELEPFDPPTVIAALAIIAVVTTAAAMLPARRAARLNPAATLQSWGQSAESSNAVDHARRTVLEQRFV
jgi:putative ABC transport system permease protein